MRLMMIFAFLLLTGCGYTMALGKKCTPDMMSGPMSGL